MSNYFLTEEDRKLLVKLHKSFGGGRVNPAIDRLGFDIYDEGNQAPETYLALVPSGGIPAATGTGGGALGFVQGDVAGSVSCAIYRLLDGVLFSIEQNRTVYNITADAITQQWVTVTRDKFGQWVAQVSGGSTCTSRNEVWQIWMIGDPLGGSFTLTLIVNAVSGTITIDYDSTAAQAETAFETHAQIGVGDVDVTAGPLPTTNLTIEFLADQANTAIDAPSINTTGLSITPGTGTTGDLDGIGVIVTRYQPGITV